MQQAPHSRDTVSDLISWLEAADHGELPDVRPGTEGDSVDGIVPQLVVAARSVRHIAAAVRYANTHGLRVIPRAGGTQMNWGGVLKGADLLLDMSALDRVVSYQPADMTITVHAGCRLGDLQATLATNHQFLPVDPALDPQATVGGLVATNAAGPLQQAFGTIRDYLLGMSLVRVNGDIVNSGGQVVKNAAGYELTKLFTGSLGTLGILTELTFMVRPIPEAKAMVFIPLARIESVEPVIASLLDATLEISLLELVNRPALERFPKEVLPSEAESAAYGILVGFMGSATSVTWQAEYVREVVRSLPAPADEKSDVVSVPWDATYGGLLKARHTRPEALICRATLLSSEIASFIERTEAVLRLHQQRAALMAHAGTGVVHVHIDPIPDDPAALVRELLQVAAAEPTAPVVPALSDHAAYDVVGRSIFEVPGLGDLAELRRLGAGNLVVESAPFEVRRILPVWGKEPADRDLSADIKRKLDPMNILNPGRVAGG